MIFVGSKFRDCNAQCQTIGLISMKYKLFAIFVFLCLSELSKAQVIILNDNLLSSRMGTVKTIVLDSLSNEPVPFASVYLVPANDTTVTNFTLTDDKGAAELKEVPFGRYVFHVEFMGYKPVAKEKYLRVRELDMGTIKLKADDNFLQAVVVSDVGNPMIVKKDTVEFNASSFRIGANEMLKDLLRKMPGMEIREDGKVVFNGEEIDKITVGGRTFFFNDQSTALNNLPASIVDKIRVIDRDSESSRASGIEDGIREKVMDVVLKKEYESGWFGNMGIKGGPTFSESDSDGRLKDNRDVLYSGNALLSAYGKKDQVTLIANAQNVNDSNMILIIKDRKGERSSLGQGLTSSTQLGLNVNTSRIKDVETTVGANYKYSDTESGTEIERITYQDNGTLGSTSENKGRQYANSINANMEFDKEEGKVWFHVRPSFSYGKSDSHSAGKSETYRDGELLNASENYTQSSDYTRNTDLDADVTIKELWGKKGRSIKLSAFAAYNSNSGESEEINAITTSSGVDTRMLRFLDDLHALDVEGSFKYIEPLGNRWSLSLNSTISYSRNENNRDAYDDAGFNVNYSTRNTNNNVDQEYGLTAQYKLNENFWFTLGGAVMGTINETTARTNGKEYVTGKDDRLWSLVPTFRLFHGNDFNRFNYDLYWHNEHPGSSRMIPALDISNPVRISVGNVYLKPYKQAHFYFSWSRSKRDKFSSTMAYLSCDYSSNPVVSAQWYDKNGVMYFIPVNSRKPSLSMSLFVYYTKPLDRKKEWSININSNISCTETSSFLADGTLEGLDKDKFNYSQFMETFWGSASGERFYGGLSGFSENRTTFWRPSLGLSIKCNHTNWSVICGAGSSASLARYSFDPGINSSTFDTHIDVKGTYMTKHEFELKTDISYIFYNGYSKGYGKPVWSWDGEISKSIGPFNLSVKMNDILNQSRNLTHTVTANYQEDSYRLTQGRYILFGIKWNFGKMNAVNSRRAQSAAWDMAL